MIKNIYFSLLLIAGLTLTACSSDNDSVEQAPKTYFMTVDATKGVNEAASRAYSRALNLAGSTLSASWATSERVYVQGQPIVGETFWFEGSLQPQTAGTTTRLNGTISLPEGWTISIDDAIGNPHYVNLQFPRKLFIYEGQIGTLADIAANYDYALAENVRVDIAADKVVGVNEVVFENQQAIVKFMLVEKNNETNVLSPTSLTIDYKTTPAASLTIPAETYEANGNGVLYTAIPGFTKKDIDDDNVTSSHDVTLTAICDDGTYTYTRSEVTFQNGKYYEILVKMTKQP